MAVTTHATNTSTPTVGTELFLPSADVSTTGIYVLKIDASVLLAGDYLWAYVYTKVRAGGTARRTVVGAWNGPAHPDKLHKFSEPLPNDLAESQAMRFSILQSRGTARPIPWTVMKLD